MGFWDSILRRDQVAVFSPRVEYIGGNEELADHYGIASSFDHATPASLWRTQPHLRTVVSFLARNVAQLGLQFFERVDETDRRRDRTSLVARTLAFPDGTMTGYDLIYALVGDVCLYDRAFWFVAESTATPTGWMIRRLPPSWVSVEESDLFTVKKWRISQGNQSIVVDASQILAFTGYSPTDPKKGSPTIESLRTTLQEQVEASKYRAQVWKRGGRVSSVLQRPANAPKWSDPAREAFREDWYAKYTGRGPKAGGTPILEDGMTLQRVDFNAQEQQFVEAAKLSLVTVASAFHVNPTMIGQNDGANYSNVREFRRMLYGDTLGPLLAQIEARVNTFLLPMLGVDAERFYGEFNIAEKLQGSFEEQAAAMQSATGAPWMLRSEARARMNLPAVPGADELVVPLNVLSGGQASPTDSGSQNRNAGKAPALKGRAPATYVTKHEQVLQAFFKRQAAAVRSRLGAKADDDWWDEERWDGELASDLYKLAVATSQQVAAATLKRLGVSPDEYDVDRTLAFLDAVSKSRAANINATTRKQIEAALEDDDPMDAVSGVFDVAKSSRSTQIAITAVTACSGFASSEAAKQVAGDAATKTWIAGANARPSHASMSGETVPLSENFSNGLAWPGDAGDADEVAGCNCELEINIP
ncbi:phage portal protein [Terrabacter terrigena]|uniref:Phage portal protein n=1 Tax=Terrabacter terrigena TaxID=574718 RepID=A0ABW3N033_9MICO